MASNHITGPFRAALIVFAGLFATLQAAGQSSLRTVPPPFPVPMTGLSSGRGDLAGAEAYAQEVDATADGKKSVGLAVLYSLLLPGMGELYAGDYGTGKYFTGADGVLWISLAAIDNHGTSMQDDARTYAALHAGFDPSGKDDDYYIDVSNFNDVYAYNEQVLRDRDAYKLYDPTSAQYWKWDSDGNRSAYRDQRVASDAILNNTQFIVAALMVNRVLSAINAARIVISGNREKSGDALEIGANVLGGPFRPHGIALSITRQF